MCVWDVLGCNSVFIRFYKSWVASPLKATLRRRIGSARSGSSNQKAALAPPATSLVWRNTEQEFRLCGGVDSLVDEATPAMTILCSIQICGPWRQLISCKRLGLQRIRRHSCLSGLCQTWLTVDETKCSPWCSELDCASCTLELLSGTVCPSWRVSGRRQWICWGCCIWTSCPTGWQTCPCFHTLTWRTMSCQSWLWGSSQVRERGWWSLSVQVPWLRSLSNSNKVWRRQKATFFSHQFELFKL